MSLQSPGKDISSVEVTHVSSHGIWLLTAEKELFLPYERFPWFREVPISSIFNVIEISPGHFFWQDLDIDLGLESIEHPERFPLIYKET